MNNTFSDYLYKKASLQKVPLFGCFELSPVCNFSCKMCYVRKTYAQIQKEGKRLLNWKEWLELAKQCKDEGTLYLLLSGGEPFIYPHFKELYSSLHSMGFVLSINSNGTMIDEETIKWLKTMAPSRVNITLYGSSRETYLKICGNPEGYDKAIKAILMLKEVGIPVVINASMIPENSQDMKDIIEFGKKHNINTRVSTYMFPPIRRDRETGDSRFPPEVAGKMYVQKFVYQLRKEQLLKYVKDKLDTLNNKDEVVDNDWGAHKEEFMRCRAGRSSFWISWDGTMTACGLLSYPLQVNPFENSFKDCWLQLTNTVRTTTVLKECKNCSKKEICNPCVAMLHSEVGSVDKKSPYLCTMTDQIILEMKKLLSELEENHNE